MAMFERDGEYDPRNDEQDIDERNQIERNRDRGLSDPGSRLLLKEKTFISENERYVKRVDNLSNEFGLFREATQNTRTTEVDDGVFSPLVEEMRNSRFRVSVSNFKSSLVDPLRDFFDEKYRDMKEHSISQQKQTITYLTEIRLVLENAIGNQTKTLSTRMRDAWFNLTKSITSGFITVFRGVIKPIMKGIGTVLFGTSSGGGKTTTEAIEEQTQFLMSGKIADNSNFFSRIMGRGLIGSAVAGVASLGGISRNSAQSAEIKNSKGEELNTAERLTQSLGRFGWFQNIDRYDQTGKDARSEQSNSILEETKVISERNLIANENLLHFTRHADDIQFSEALSYNDFMRKHAFELNAVTADSNRGIWSMVNRSYDLWDLQHQMFDAMIRMNASHYSFSGNKLYGVEKRLIEMIAHIRSGFFSMKHVMGQTKEAVAAIFGGGDGAMKMEDQSSVVPSMQMEQKQKSSPIFEHTVMQRSDGFSGDLRDLRDLTEQLYHQEHPEFGKPKRDTYQDDFMGNMIQKLIAARDEGKEASDLLDIASMMERRNDDGPGLTDMPLIRTLTQELNELDKPKGDEEAIIKTLNSIHRKEDRERDQSEFEQSILMKDTYEELKKMNQPKESRFQTNLLNISQMQYEELVQQREAYAEAEEARKNSKENSGMGVLSFLAPMLNRGILKSLKNAVSIAGRWLVREGAKRLLLAPFAKIFAVGLVAGLFYKYLLRPTIDWFDNKFGWKIGETIDNVSALVWDKTKALLTGAGSILSDIGKVYWNYMKNSWSFVFGNMWKASRWIGDKLLDGIWGIFKFVAGGLGAGIMGIGKWLSGMISDAMSDVPLIGRFFKSDNEDTERNEEPGMLGKGKEKVVGDFKEEYFEIKTGITGFFGGLIRDTKQAVTGAVPKDKEREGMISGVVGFYKDYWGGVYEKISEGDGEGKDKAKELADKTINFYKDLYGPMLSGVADSLLPEEGMFNSIKEKTSSTFGKLWGGIKSGVDDIFDKEESTKPRTHGIQKKDTIQYENPRPAHEEMNSEAMIDAGKATKEAMDMMMAEMKQTKEVQLAQIEQNSKIIETLMAINGNTSASVKVFSEGQKAQITAARKQSALAGGEEF